MGINDVIDAIAIKLKQDFGYTIYVDKVPQNFKTPSFLIQLISLDTQRELGYHGSRLKWNVAPLFDIQYFSDDGRSDLFSKSLDINLALERIQLVNGDIILSTNQNNEIQDDICHNFMNFNFRLTEEQKKDFMETLELNTRLRTVQ